MRTVTNYTALPCHSEFQTLWGKIVREPQQSLGRVKVALRHLLRSVDLVGWSKREEAGRLDRRALTRYAVGDAAIFSRRDYAESERSAVSILVDVSGSTGDRIDKARSVTRLEVFRNIAVHLSKLISDCRVPCEIVTFSGSVDFDANGIKQDVHFNEVKSYSETVAAAGAKIAAITRLIRGATPAYSALRLSIEAISKRQESRKILFVLTDADDFVVSETRQLDLLAEHLGVVLIVIGCGDVDVTQCFVNAARVKSETELFAQSFNVLLRSLQKK